MLHLRLTAFIIFVLLINKIPIAQTYFNNYRVEYSQQPYTSLKNPTYMFFNDQLWLDSSYKTNYLDARLDNLFSYKLNGENLTHFVYYIPYFQIGFENDTYYDFHTTPIASNTREYSDIIPYQTSVVALIDSSTSERIFKVEFKQVGLTDTTWKTKGYLNMQYWYYSNGDFEVRYGDCQIPAELWNVKKKYNTNKGNYKLNFTISNDSLFVAYNMAVVGLYNNPRLYKGINKSFTDLMYDSALNQIPPTGSVYRFTTSKVGTSELSNTENEISIYPNPSSGLIRINGLKSSCQYEIKLYDYIGNNVNKHLEVNINDKVDLQKLSDGIYFLTIKNEDKISTKRFIIKH